MRKKPSNLHLILFNKFVGVLGPFHTVKKAYTHLLYAESASSWDISAGKEARDREILLCLNSQHFGTTVTWAKVIGQSSNT